VIQLPLPLQVPTRDYESLERWATLVSRTYGSQVVYDRAQEVYTTPSGDVYPQGDIEAIGLNLERRERTP
jgi:hypothetical protein